MYDEQDKAVAHIAWPFACAPEIWAICDATLLASGNGKQQTMAHFKNHACKTLHDALVRSKDPQVRKFLVFICILCCDTCTVLAPHRTPTDCVDP